MGGKAGNNLPSPNEITVLIGTHLLHSSFRKAIKRTQPSICARVGRLGGGTPDCWGRAVVYVSSKRARRTIQGTTG